MEVFEVSGHMTEYANIYPLKYFWASTVCYYIYFKRWESPTSGQIFYKILVERKSVQCGIRVNLKFCRVCCPCSVA